MPISMQRALIIGSPGSGKSTFARALQRKTGLPLHYLDMLWHLPDRTTVTAEEFDRRLGEILRKERWIIDGNYSRTMPERLAACDMVFLFDLPASACLANVRSRIGHQRPDMPWVERAEDPEFMKYIADFPAAKFPRLEQLTGASGRNVQKFRSRHEALAYLDALS